jgi:hypothetical protein
MLMARARSKELRASCEPTPTFILTIANCCRSRRAASPRPRQSRWPAAARGLSAGRPAARLQARNDMSTPRSAVCHGRWAASAPPRVPKAGHADTSLLLIVTASMRRMGSMNDHYITRSHQQRMSYVATANRAKGAVELRRARSGAASASAAQLDKQGYELSLLLRGRHAGGPAPASTSGRSCRSRSSSCRSSLVASRGACAPAPHASIGTCWAPYMVCRPASAGFSPCVAAGLRAKP